MSPKERVHACCAPPAPRVSKERAVDVGRGGRPGHAVALLGGTFAMGSDDAWAYPEDAEGPVRRRTVGAFRIECCTVIKES